MDATSAMERMSDLEDRLRRVTQERNNYSYALLNYEAFLKCVPRTLPGSDQTVTPYEWLKWATANLGYETVD